VDGELETGHENPEGALLCAALIRGYPLFGLKHILKRLEGTIWHRIAKDLGNIRNGDAPERLVASTKGKRIAGFDERGTRDYVYARIAEVDGRVEHWLAEDPKVLERRRFKRAAYAGVADMYTNTTWLWDKWLPRGYLSMIVGRPGVGKSMVGVWLAKILTGGGTWPDGTINPLKCENPRGHADGDCSCPTVMWIDTEGTQPLLLERLKQMGISLGKVFYPEGDKPEEETFPQIDLKQERWREIIHGIAIEDRPDWIHVDSLRGSHTGKERDDDHMQRILSWSAALCRDLGNAFTFTHHQRKSHPGEPETIAVDSVRGSSVIPAMMRVIMALDVPNPKEETLRLHQVKNNLCRMPEAIGITLAEEGCPIVADEVPEAIRAASLVERAIDFLKARLSNGPRIAEEIYYEAKQVGISERTLQRAKVKLELVNLARSTQHPKYRWALRDSGERDDEEPQQDVEPDPF
jgi:putative DNA primase/helicase